MIKIIEGKRYDSERSEEIVFSCNMDNLIYEIIVIGGYIKKCKN